MAELISAWLAGEADNDDVREAIGELADRDATDWGYYASAVTDPIDALERAALATILGRD